MKPKSSNSVVFILVVVFVVTALASFMMKLVPKNETPNNNNPTIKPSPIEPEIHSVEDVELTKTNYTFSACN